MMCPKCLRQMSGNYSDIDCEIVCESCGSAYTLEYLGYYPEGSDDRIDEGFEDKQQEDLVNRLRLTVIRGKEK
jgi:hypothetical protein